MDRSPITSVLWELFILNRRNENDDSGNLSELSHKDINYSDDDLQLSNEGKLNML